MLLIALQPLFWPRLAWVGDLGGAAVGHSTSPCQSASCLLTRAPSKDAVSAAKCWCGWKRLFCFLAGFLTSWLTTKQSGAPYYYRGGVESDRELKVFRLSKAKLFCTLLRRGVCKLILCFLSPSCPVHAPFPHPVGHPPATVVARGAVRAGSRQPLMLLRLHWSKSSVSWDRGGHMWGVMAKNPRMCVAVKIFVHKQYIVHWVI